MLKRFQWSLSSLVLLLLALLSGLVFGTHSAGADDAAPVAASVASLLQAESDVDALFLLVLPETTSANTELRIQLPRQAESLLPPAQAGSVASAVHCETIWLMGGKAVRRSAVWQCAGRGLESQLRIEAFPVSKAIKSSSLLLVGRVNSRDDDRRPQFRCRIIQTGEPRERAMLCSYFGLVQSEVRPGVFGIYSPWGVRGPPVRSEALRKFLKTFEQITARGFVPTERSGSTGIGYTLESLLDIRENNDPGGDFFGLELKAHRYGAATSGSKRMNLFLKEPTWTDGLSHRDRIPKYGYVDDNGRVALYSTVTSQENSHGLRVTIDEEGRKLELNYRGKPVAYWTFEILQSRLAEKLSETAFVGATARGTGRSEEFHYDSVLFCQQPSVDSLVALIKSRESMVEMRMHIREDGSARNHGTAFRVQQDQLPRLFTRTVQRRVSKE